MRSVVLFILLTRAFWGHAKDELVDKLVNKLITRALKMRLLHRVDRDRTTLVKAYPDKMNRARSRITPPLSISHSPFPIFHRTHPLLPASCSKFPVLRSLPIFQELLEGMRLVRRGAEPEEVTVTIAAAAIAGAAFAAISLFSFQRYSLGRFVKFSGQKMGAERAMNRVLQDAFQSSYLRSDQDAEELERRLEKKQEEEGLLSDTWNELLEQLPVLERLQAQVAAAADAAKKQAETAKERVRGKTTKGREKAAAAAGGPDVADEIASARAESAAAAATAVVVATRAAERAVAATKAIQAAVSRIQETAGGAGEAAEAAAREATAAKAEATEALAAARAAAAEAAADAAAIGQERLKPED